MAGTFDLIDVCSNKVKAGTLVRMYRTKTSNVSAYPVTVSEYNAAQDPVVADVAGDRFRLHGDIVLIDGAKWQQFDVKVNSGKPLHSMVGEMAAAALVASVEFQIEGYGPEQIEFGNDSTNPCWIYLVELKNGKTVSIGRPGIPAYAESIDGDGGLKSGDFAGQTFKIVSDVEPYFYSGAIDLTA